MQDAKFCLEELEKSPYPPLQIFAKAWRWMLQDIKAFEVVRAHLAKSDPDFEPCLIDVRILLRRGLLEGDDSRIQHAITILRRLVDAFHRALHTLQIDHEPPPKEFGLGEPDVQTLEELGRAYEKAARRRARPPIWTTPYWKNVLTR